MESNNPDEQQQQEDDGDKKPAAKKDGDKKPTPKNDDDVDDDGSSSSLSTVPAAAAAAPAPAADEAPQKAKRGARKRMRMSEDGELYRMSHQKRWDEMFERLKEFKRKHGHCRVPNRYAKDTQLGSWVSAQRRQYRIVTQGEEGSAALTPDRANKLIQLGFESTTNPHHTPWETRYEALKKFVKRFGHAEVPMRWDDEPKLSHWVSKQRHDYKLRKEGKSSRLSDDKVRLLNDIGFRWEGTRRSIQKKIQAINTDTSEFEASQTSSTGASAPETNEGSLSENVNDGVAAAAATLPVASTNTTATAAAEATRRDPTTTFASTDSGRSAAANSPATTAQPPAAAQPNTTNTQTPANNDLTQQLLSLFNASSAPVQQPERSRPSQSGSAAGDLQQLLTSVASSSANQNQTPAPLAAQPAAGGTNLQQLLPLVQLIQQLLPAGTSTSAPSTAPLQQLLVSMLNNSQQLGGAVSALNNAAYLQQLLSLSAATQETNTGAVNTGVHNSNSVQQPLANAANAAQQQQALTSALLSMPPAMQQLVVQQAVASLLSGNQQSRQLGGSAIQSQIQQQLQSMTGTLNPFGGNANTQLVLFVPISGLSLPTMMQGAPMGSIPLGNIGLSGSVPGAVSEAPTEQANNSGSNEESQESNTSGQGNDFPDIGPSEAV